MGMTMEEAMHARHMVRAYTKELLSEEQVRLLEERIDSNNRNHGTSIRLVRGDSKAISGAMRLTMAKNVREYFLMDVILERQAAKSCVRADASSCTDPLLVVGNDESRLDT